MKKQKKGKNKGITLIALVITIIIMLILVAVTVNYSIKSGLLSKAKEGTTGYTYKEEEDEIGEIRLAYTVDSETGKANGTLKEYLEAELSDKAAVELTAEGISVLYNNSKTPHIIKEENKNETEYKIYYNCTAQYLPGDQIDSDYVKLYSNGNCEFHGGGFLGTLGMLNCIPEKSESNIYIYKVLAEVGEVYLKIEKKGCYLVFYTALANENSDEEMEWFKDNYRYCDLDSVETLEGKKYSSGSATINFISNHEWTWSYEPELTFTYCIIDNVIYYYDNHDDISDDRKTFGRYTLVEE